VETTQIEKFMEHKELDQFVVNTHAFHNAHLLRETLPRSLTMPTPLFDNREEKHHEMAQTLRDVQITKKNAKAAAKAQQALEGTTQQSRTKTGRKTRKRPRAQHDVDLSDEEFDEGVPQRRAKKRRRTTEESSSSIAPRRSGRARVLSRRYLDPDEVELASSSESDSDSD